MHHSISLLGWQHWVTCGIALSEVETISLAVFPTVTALSQKTRGWPANQRSERGLRATCHVILQPLLTFRVIPCQRTPHPWAAETRVFPSILVTGLVMNLLAWLQCENYFPCGICHWVRYVIIGLLDPQFPRKDRWSESETACGTGVLPITTLQRTWPWSREPHFSLSRCQSIKSRGPQLRASQPLIITILAPSSKSQMGK